MSREDIIEKVLELAFSLAEDNSHGYDQIDRWGPDFDCSSSTIHIWNQVGVPVKSFGATYTGNMYAAFIKAGFTNVVSKVNVSTGEGLFPGDVLLRTSGHAATYLGDKKILQAAGNELGTTTGGKPGDQTKKEIYIRSYYNSPWDVILRYKEDEMKNPFIEPTQTYKAGVPFYGNDAQWFIWELVKRGYDLIVTSTTAGKNTWEAIYAEQKKGGLEPGDAGPKTRALFKQADPTDYEYLYEVEKARGDKLQAKIDAALSALTSRP